MIKEYALVESVMTLFAAASSATALGLPFFSSLWAASFCFYSPDHVTRAGITEIYLFK